MIMEIEQLVDQYLVWLRDKTTLRQIGDQWVEITTPYLDRHNDYIQLYTRQFDNGYILTDDGETITDLEHTGCKLESSKRQKLLNMTLNGFGVQMSEKKLEVHASRDNFALRKHNLIQAILAVNDMFYLAIPLVASLFYEDVVSWLDMNEVRYTPKIKFTGKSGYDHLFDFVIPKSRRQPERIIQTINRPNRDTAQAVAFAWIDTKEVRAPDSRAYAFLNDREQKISSSVIDALHNYGVSPIYWSERDKVSDELVE